MLRRTLIVIIVVVVILLLLFCVRIWSEKNMLWSQSVLKTDTDGKYFNDGTKGKPYYHEVFLGYFINKWLELRSPMFFLSISRCDTSPHTILQIGSFLDAKGFEPKCYGVKIPYKADELRREGNTKDYFSCYGLRIVGSASCIID